MTSEHSFSIAVMSHPARAEAAAALSARLPGSRVVMDPDPGDDPSPLKTSIHAWRAVEPGMTHQLVVQDDVIPAEQFLDRVRNGIEMFPDAVLTFYATWNSRNAAAVRLAGAAGATWVEEIAGEYFPTLAVVLPANRIEEYTEFASTYTRWWGQDDEMLRDFIVTRGLSAYTAVPCLAEHGDLESAAGNQSHGLRQAPCFLPEPVHDISYEALAHSIDFVPWMSRNRAQALTRIVHEGRNEWLKRPWRTLADPLGLDLDVLHEQYRRTVAASPSLSAARDELTDVFCEGLWQTAYGIGAVQRAGLVPVKLLSGDTVRPGPDRLVAAGLRTLAVGGAGWTALPAPLLERLTDETAGIAEAGYAAGCDVETPPR